MTRAMKTALLTLAVAAAIALLAPPLQAHHSHGNYDDRFIDLEGVVEEIHLLNPHSGSISP